MNRITLALAGLFFSLQVAAQSSVNTFSPFTFYGLGDIRAQGVASQAGMGGVGIGDRGAMNYMNPASLSAVPRNSVGFNFGIEGSFHYLKEGERKSSYNTFNINDLVFRVPLAKRFGFGASLTPYSSVGYRVVSPLTDEAMLAKLYGQGILGANRIYKGSGDVSQAKFSLGWQPVKRLSVGIDMIYYFGGVDRNASMEVIAGAADINFPSTAINHSEDVSRIQWGFGAQYNLIDQSRRRLTLGATFLPGGKLNVSSSLTADNATGTPQPLPNVMGGDFKLPRTFGAGLHYQTWRLGAGLDFEHQRWAEANKNRGLRNTDAFRAGAEFTPSRYDVRNPLKRVTYRLGVRASDYYMTFNGHNISEKAVTAGFGIPFKTDRESYLDIGFEYGSRGSAKTIKENFFRVSIGFRLRGDGWFQKMMYL